MNDEEKDTVLSEIYYNPSSKGSFSSPSALFRSVKESGYEDITRKNVNDFLQKQDVYTLSRETKRKHKTRKVISPYIGYQHDVDLADMRRHSKQNDGVCYIFVLIDIFSRKVYTTPIKTKNAFEIINAFQYAIKNGAKIERIRSDGGSEFNSEKLLKYFKQNNIKHFVNRNIPKANYAERVIKTLKQKIIRYMSKNNTHKWIDVLDDLSDSYNKSYHRSIGKAPKDVIKKDEIKLWRRMYDPIVKVDVKKEIKKKKVNYIPKVKFKFKVMDVVRVAYERVNFSKHYDESFSRELYYITNMESKAGVAMYSLSDYDKDEVKGKFYSNELQKVSIGEDHEFIIDRVIKTTGSGKNKKALVRWWGWSKKFDSYIPYESVKLLKPADLDA